jgi:uncharacterized membrane protein YfcA
VSLGTALLWLVPTALAGATLSGILGMGGGLLLITVMASVLEPIQVVPVHGAVQLVSNGTRALRLGESLTWFKPFVGGFVLLMLVWDRFRPQRLELPTWLLVPGGVVGGVLTVLVGATGPYLASFFLRDDMDRREVVATKATMQVVGHLVKIPAFLSVGFNYAVSIWLIVPLLACAVAGTFLGTSLLGKLPETRFRIGFRVLLAALAIRLIMAR